MLPQNVTINCQFLVSVYDQYACALFGIEVLDPSQGVIIGGQHIGNRTNDDVEFVWIFTSNTPFMIPEIFTTFPNIIELDIDFSNLQSIKIPDTVRLMWLDLFGNNIARIESDSIRNQTELLECFLSYNNIQEIDEGAFEGLSELIYLELFINDIEYIEPRTFHPLTNMMVLDLEGNWLSSVGDLFSENRKLQTLYLEYNEIEEIHPRFNANLRDSLRLGSFYGNECVDSGFSLVNEVDWAVMNSALSTCFRNFNGTSSTEEKNLAMELEGSLRIYDGFGNLIARV